MAASLPPAALPAAHSHATYSSYAHDNFPGVVRGSGGVMLGGFPGTRETVWAEESEKAGERDKTWGGRDCGGKHGERGAAQGKRGEKNGSDDAKAVDTAVRNAKSNGSTAREEGEVQERQNADPGAENDSQQQAASSAARAPANRQVATTYQDAVRHAAQSESAAEENEEARAGKGALTQEAHAPTTHVAEANAGSGVRKEENSDVKAGEERAADPLECGSSERDGEVASDAASAEPTAVLNSPCSTEPSRENSNAGTAMDLDGFGAQGGADGAKEGGEDVWQASAGKRKAEELGLDEDALMVAQILTGALGSAAAQPQRKQHKTKERGARAAAAAAGRAAGSRGGGGGGGGDKEGEVSTPPASNPLPKPSGQARGPGTGHRRQSPMDSYANVPVPGWARLVIDFLEQNGQELLHAICAHYRIDFLGDVSQIREYSLEQIAHNALFNPALPKASGRLPKMLRDMEGVTDFKMTFVKEGSGIYRNVRVSARLKAQPLNVECRSCSYCGSCFSGRFMKPNAMHQQAGGWKEITERTQAGKFSWESLRGWRLCVPCFTHWASNGTNVNANRPSIDDLLSSDQHDLNYDIVTAEHLYTGKAEVQHLNAQNSQAHSLAMGAAGEDAAADDKMPEDARTA